MEEERNIYDLIFRVISIGSHALLGANAAARVGNHPLTGVPSAIVLESLSHSELASSLPGGAAVVAGYAPLALANLDFKPLTDWFKLQWLKFKYTYLMEDREPIPPPVTEEEMADIRKYRPFKRGYASTTPEPSYPPQFRGGRLR